jgi:protein bicaudal D
MSETEQDIIVNSNPLKILDYESLQTKIELLEKELLEEKQSSKQAAEYGLTLLEDFKKTQSRNFELEAEIEQCRSELDQTNLEFKKLQKKHKLEENKDIDKEDTLLNESLEREEKLKSQLNSLQIESYKDKQEIERVYNENEKLILLNEEKSVEYERLKDNLVNHKAEIKSLKDRENRLLVDNTELDGENVQLQQQILKLREDLIELDTVRHENRGLEEKVDNLEAQCVELSSLKRIVERQLQDSLNSFREEHEHRFQRERQSHERREKQSLKELKTIATNLAAADPNADQNQILYDLDIEVDDDEDDNQQQQQNQLQQEPGSLFNELHANDLQRLESNIEDLTKQKNQIETELTEFKADINSLLYNIDHLNKKVSPQQQIKKEDTEDIKLNKQVLAQFEKFKINLEKVLLSNSSDKLNNKKENEDNFKMNEKFKDNLVIIISSLNYGFGFLIYGRKKCFQY